MIHTIIKAMKEYIEENHEDVAGIALTMIAIFVGCIGLLAAILFTIWLAGLLVG